jgi:hypothetical protein
METVKRSIVKHLREVTFCMVEESNVDIDCTKNRFGNRTMDSVKNVKFEKVKLSQIGNDVQKVRNEFYGKNLWLLLDQ